MSQGFVNHAKLEKRLLWKLAREITESSKDVIGRASGSYLMLTYFQNLLLDLVPNSEFTTLAD